MKPIRIMVGCIYFDRRGEEITIVDTVDPYHKPRLYKLGYRFFDVNGEVYTDTGRFNVFERSKYDLISIKQSNIDMNNPTLLFHCKKLLSHLLGKHT